MHPIRVLVVDESSLTRELLRQLLGADRELEVVAVTASGRVALAKIPELNPDVVLLDVVPPDRQGLQTLAALRQAHPSLPVIVFSRIAERSSQTSVDALLMGANDCIAKPESREDLERCICGALSEKIKSLGSRQSPSELQSRPRAALASATSSGVQPVSSSTPRPVVPSASRIEIVAIAASTGGPSALGSLLSALPPSFSTPIVVVQHMASAFTTSLAYSLSRQSGRDVREVTSTQPLFLAPVWVATGGRHLVVTRQGATTQVTVNDDPPENECRPSADVLFRSVASVFGGHCLAIVLTGMGCDGMAGCRVIRQAGGTILAQDEASSVSWGMPGQVATAGLADLVLPLSDLPREISRLTSRS